MTLKAHKDFERSRPFLRFFNSTFPGYKSMCACTLLKKLQNYNFLKKQAEEINILINFEFKFFPPMTMIIGHHCYHWYLFKFEKF